MKLMLQENWGTVASISSVEDEIVVSPDFYKLDKYQQEYLICMLVCFKANGDNDYINADLQAYKYMRKKYPGINSVFWVETLCLTLSKAPTELTVLRIRTLSEFVKQELAK